MCGRLSQATSPWKLAEFLDIVGNLHLQARYNVPPSLPLAALRVFDGKRYWALLRWGLVPHWSKNLEASKKYSLINAKAETVAEKPAFRGPFRYRRCAVPADGYYEWREENGKKLPFYIKRTDDRPLLLAGLWDLWDRDGSVFESCTLLTTQASQKLRVIHHRMPVLLDFDTVDTWLDPEIQTAEPLQPLLSPKINQELTFYRVTPRMNRPAFDSPECIQPLESNSNLP